MSWRSSRRQDHVPVMVQVPGACSTVPSDFIQQHTFEDKSMNFKAATGGFKPQVQGSPE